MGCKEKVILIGAFCEAIELCEDCGFEIVGIVDSLEEATYMGYPVLGDDELILLNSHRYTDYKVVLVPDSPHVRYKLAKQYGEKGFRFATVISPDAHVSKTAKIGEGCLIQANCNVSSYVELGDFVRLNSCANVMHESSIGKCSTVAPNAVVLGRCVIEEFSYIGANSTVLPNRTIYSNAIVGAGAVVTKNVEKNSVVAGNPARVLG